MTLSYISKKYYLPLKVTIAELTGTEYEIKFILPEQTKNIRTGNNGVPKKNALSEKADRSNLNPNYTFDTFVVGSNNRFAQSASLAVAESPVKHTILSIFMEDRDLGKLTLCIPSVIYIREKPERKSTLCYIRRIYQRSNRVDSKW